MEKKTRDKIIGARLKKIRQDKGITAYALSKMLGVTPQTIYHFESGINVPGDAQKPKIKSLLGIDLPSREEVKNAANLFYCISCPISRAEILDALREEAIIERD